MNRETLTDRQLEILNFMLKNAKPRYPTVREIGKHFQLSPATTQGHIEAIRRKGYLRESKNSSCV